MPALSALALGEGEDGELYVAEYFNDLDNDIGETKNLASERRGRVADLKRKLQAWRQEVLARMSEQARLASTC